MRIQRQFRANTLTWTVCAVAAVSVAAGLWAFGQFGFSEPALAQTPPKSGPVLVRGYLATRLPLTQRSPLENPPGHDVYLPGIKVWLVDKKSARVDTGQTDLAGRFSLYGTSHASYQVCWEAPGFGSGCNEAFFLSTQPLMLSTVTVPLTADKKFVAVFGNVRMADGSSTRTYEPLANVNAFAEIALVDKAKKTIYRTSVNDFGEYVIPRVPVGGDVAIEAKLEGASLVQPILPQSELYRASVHRYDLWFTNHRPVLDPVVPLDAGTMKSLQVAAPGQKIAFKAVAKDRDGDALHYYWIVNSGGGTLSTATGPQTVLTTSGAGGFGVTAIVWDKKGGYARIPTFIRAGKPDVAFSGTVTNNLSQRVDKAQVEVNGKQILTDGLGRFSLRVPVRDRYVFNIRATGYGFYSKIYPRAVGGGLWRLTAATVTPNVDPTQPIDVVDRRKQTDCKGPAFTRVNWETYRSKFQPQWQDGKGNVIFPSRRDTEKRGQTPPMPWDFKRSGACGPGISLHIPANALVDEHGNAPAGKVRVSLSTVDLMTPEQMPGDYSVAVGGGTKVMDSFGAGSIDISAGGHRYNLKHGPKATLTIPVDAAQLNASGPIPAIIPLLYYDERNGVWTQDGKLTLQGAGNARRYVADIPHFSTVNADTLKTGQACVRVNSPGLPSSYNLEVVVPQTSGNAPKIFHQLINNASPSQHVVFNLPVNTNISLVPTLLGADTTPVGVFIVNTGGAQSPTTPNQPAGPPYAACSTEVTLAPQAIPTTPLDGEFLQGLTSFFAGDYDELATQGPDGVALKAALQAASQNYTQQIDPRGKRPNLTEFRKTNGFIDNALNPLPGVTNAKYANSGDLGFGRDMSCKKQVADDGKTDYACYVSNLGDIDGSDQTDANDVVDGIGLFATVAMEYSRIENAPADPNEFDDASPRTVKFYVYNAAGNPVHDAKLDDRGNRPVPQLCMVCHGGALPNSITDLATGKKLPVFTARSDVLLGSRFIPFDLRYFTFPDRDNFRKADAPVQAAFKSLNVDIVKALADEPDVGATAISEVVNEMYSGGAANQHEDFSVPGWRAPAVPEPAKPTFYKNVVSNACRTCHTAQPFANIQFNTAAGFITKLSAVGTRACTNHVMPHAERTHEIFWGIYNPDVVVPPPPANMGGQLQIFGGQFGPAADWIGIAGNPPTYLCGTSFTSGGASPLSYYLANIQPLLNSGTGYGCAGCHGGAAGLNLASGDFYDGTNGLAPDVAHSTQVPAMFRIKKGSVANSYVWHKLQGDGTMAAGTKRMPYNCVGAACVNATDMATIQDWIDNRNAEGP